MWIVILLLTGVLLVGVAVMKVRTDRQENVVQLKARICSMLTTGKTRLFNIYGVIKKLSVTVWWRYKALAMPLKVAIAAGCSVIWLIVFVAVFIGHPHNTSSPAATKKAVIKQRRLENKSNSSSSITGGVNDDLTDLQAKLVHIEKMLSSRRSVVNIDQVRADIHGLNQEITHIEQDNKTQYSALRSQITNLSSQLDRYQKTTASKLDEIEAVKNKVTCVSRSHLPFTVQSIDMVNGRNVVSVLYANMVSPLENDFTLAGWKLASSDYEHQTARFVNRTGVCASVNLNGHF